MIRKCISNLILFENFSKYFHIVTYSNSKLSLHNFTVLHNIEIKIVLHNITDTVKYKLINLKLVLNYTPQIP